MRATLTILLLLLVYSIAPAQAQTEPIPPGKIIPKVSCSRTPAQSYAVYLPSTYNSARAWPILYSFDPGARGALPVNRFQEAAEKYGWIVVGSNNSQNGAMQQSLDAWAAIWDDTHQRFNIDAKRVYAAGFSGGARVAIYFAKMCNDCVAGVIACGAGFPVGVTPSSDLRFVLFGIAGVDDFNFPELRNLDSALTRVGLTHIIDSFDGRHEWPPTASAMIAVEWMELQAIRAGKRLRDEKLVAELWQKQRERASSYAAAGNPLQEYRVYAGMSGSFSDLINQDGLKQLKAKLQQLNESRDVKDALREERKQFAKQQDLSQQMTSLIEGEGGADFESENRLRSLAAELRDAGKAAVDSPNRRVARRVIEGMMIGLFERGNDQLQRQKDYAAAIKSFGTATLISPDRPGAFYYLAAAHALNGDRKKAIQALQNAVEKGFSDRAAITGNSAFESVRSDPVYLQLLQKLSDR